EHVFQLGYPGGPAEFPPLRSLDTHHHNLPLQVTQLIGRERDSAAIQHHLRDRRVRLLTITGTGGTGKTRVALQVAAEVLGRFANGVVLVSLAAVTDPALVPLEIARAL